MDVHTKFGMAVQEYKSERFIELDLLRGFAIVFMILIHLMWDLDYFGIYPLNQTLQNTNVIVQVMFFLLVGICLAVGFNKNKKPSKRKLYEHLLRRGLWIFGLGMFLTIFTMIFMPGRPIYFGVLHCIGFCIILTIPFLKFRHWNFVFATAFISAGLIIKMVHVSNPTVLHLIVGLHPADFWTYTIDYFPIFPWLGVCLLGVAFGGILYKDNKRAFIFPDISEHMPVQALSWFGRHSLVIYLIHQPVIAGVLSVYLIL